MKITITQKEFFDWIFAQPDEKELAFHQFKDLGDDACGCPMYQYGREKGWNFNACGAGEWYSEYSSDGEFHTQVVAGFENNTDIWEMTGLIYKFDYIPDMKTFGDLKKQIKKHETANTSKKS